MKIGINKFVLIGILSGIIILLAIGIPTEIIPNDVYTRMIPVTFLDIFFLIVISVMLGVYIALFFYLKEKKKKQKIFSAYGGATGGILAVSCPICIKLLVLIFGTTALMTYLEPARPYIGFLSIGLIGYGLFTQIKMVKKSCEVC